MAEIPPKQGLREGKTPENRGFPQGPSRKIPEAAPRPPYSSDTIGGYLVDLKPAWRKKVREQFKSRGGKDGKLNKTARELLADSVFDVVNALESKYENPPAKVQATCAKLFDIMNLIYEETGISEIPKWAGDQETDERGD